MSMSSVSYRLFTGSAAENYQRYFVPAIATPVSGDLLWTADLQLGEHVLDVACGTGLIARLAAERVGPTGSVSALDLAPEMIDVARTAPAPMAPDIEWYVGDAATLPFPDDSYDVVLCQMGLMFMEDRPAAVAEMRRVLMPGGRLVVSTPGSIQPLFEIMERAIVEHIRPELGSFVEAVFSMHDPDALAALVEDAGLADVSSKVFTATFQLPSPAEFLWQYINLAPMGPLIAQAPEEAQSAMERQVVESWQPFVAGGGMRVDQPMVLASGRK
jgi:ubiquinone/menaquinone biosynthesis C-methylase UbiE